MQSAVLVAGRRTDGAVAAGSQRQFSPHLVLVFWTFSRLTTLSAEHRQPRPDQVGQSSWTCAPFRAAC